MELAAYLVCQPEYVTFLGKRDWRIKHEFFSDLALKGNTLHFLIPALGIAKLHGSGQS